MKKVALLYSLLCLTLFAIAQDKQYNSVKTNFTLGQYDKALKDLEKIMQDPKGQTKPETFLWLSRVNAELVYADQNKNKNVSGFWQAGYDAFRKYEALDGSYALIQDPAVTWRALDLLYISGFNQGKALFDRKEWDSSLSFFEPTAYMGELIVKKNLRSRSETIDTMSVSFAGYAAQNAKKPATAVKYYSKIADAKFSGADYRELYAYLLIYFADAKDNANFYKYYAISKQLYPTHNWQDYELDFINKAYTPEQKITLYQQEDATNAMVAYKYLQFGDLFTEIHNNDELKLDSLSKSKYLSLSIDAYKKAYLKDNTLGLAAFNAGVNYYKAFNDLDDEYKANIRKMQEVNASKPSSKDPKKQAAIDKEYKAKIEAIKATNVQSEPKLWQAATIAQEWLEKAYQTLLNSPKRDRAVKYSLNKSVDMLATIFIYKKEKSRGKDPKAMDEYDALYKKYDELHNAY